MFVGLMGLIIICDFWLVHFPYRTTTDLQTVDFGVAMDFMLIIPFVYYMVMVRNTHRHWTTVIYVSFICSHAVLWRLHDPNLQVLSYPIDLLFVIVELRFMAQLVRVARTYRQLRGTSDLPSVEIIGEALVAHFGSNPLIRYISTDLSLFYYSLFSWSRKEYIPAGTKSFTYYVKSNARIVLIVMSKVLLLEGFATHLVVQHWSHSVAWILTASNIYLWLFLLGDYRAMRLNPITLSGSSLRFSYGLRFSLTVPISDVQGVTTVSNLDLTKAERKQALVYEPNVHLTLRRPHLARRAFGMEKMVTELYIHVDQPDVFVRTVFNLKA